jgi:hypothetical protein
VPHRQVVLTIPKQLRLRTRFPRSLLGKLCAAACDNGLGKTLAPAERTMGFGVFGVGTVWRFSGPVLTGGGNPRSNF